MPHRTTGRLLLTFAAAGLLLGCQKAAPPDRTAEITSLSAQVAELQQRLDAADKALAEQMSAVASAVAATDKTRREGAERDVVLAEKDKQLQAAQAELAAMKRRDAFAYAEASGVQAKGLTGSALARYQKFVEDFPTSPLVADANRAIAELTVANQKMKAVMADPKKEEQTKFKQVAENIVTVQEIMPVLKGRSSAEVVKILGAPNRSFRNGSEIGYLDKILDPATGQKDTLVIIFEEDRVSAIRVGYRGREMKL